MLPLLREYMEERPDLRIDLRLSDRLLNLTEQGVDIADYPNVRRWRDAIAARPAVQRGLQLLADRTRRSAPMDQKERDVLFGATQYQRR